MKGWNLLETENKDLSLWRYAGGNKGRHFNYFKMLYPKELLPEKSNECVCNQSIIENCYISYQDEIIIVGNCCIKRFIPQSTRTCELCNQPHITRTQNRCKDCKIKKKQPEKRLCKICKIMIDYIPKRPLCENCYYFS